MSLGPGRSAVVAVSLANLLLIRIWTELLGERLEPAPPVWCAAALVNLALLTALIWAVIRWGSDLGRSVLAVVSVALLAKELALSAGHAAASWKATAAGGVESGMRRGWLWPAARLALALLAWVAWCTRRVEWAASVLVVLSPVVLVTAGRAGWQVLVQPPAPKTLTQSANAVFRLGPRVVWIIFDGSVFERPGIRAGLVGWHLPYCRDYGSRLAHCQAWAMDRQLNSCGTELWKVVGQQLRSLLESSFYSVFGQSLALEAHGRTVTEMEDAAARLASRRDLSATNQDARGYLGNLELADRVFASIRASLTASGLWTQTHVLVSGDHGMRQAYKIGYSREDRHVPFMWKPAGQVQARQLDRSLETGGLGGGTAGLVSRMLDGENAESVLARYP